MKTYTFGELLGAYNDTSYIAYCYKGDLANRVIFCDKENENRLVWIDSNGEDGFDFYFGIVDSSIEEVRNFVFYHELNDYPEMQGKIDKCFAEYMINSEIEDETVVEDGKGEIIFTDYKSTNELLNRWKEMQKHFEKEENGE